jgi:hypothetical protein
MDEILIRQITRQIINGAGHRLENDTVEQYARKLWNSNAFQAHFGYALSQGCTKRYAVERTLQEVFEMDDLLEFAIDAV